MDIKATGQFIAELRKQQGLTQRQLAEKLGVTDKAVSRWETGSGLPDTALLKPLGDLLGVSVGELLSGKNIEPAHIREQTDEIILESLDYSDEDLQLKRILRYLLIGIVTAIGGLYFSLVMNRFFNGEGVLSVGIGMYLCMVVVTCTGWISTRIDKGSSRNFSR